MALDDQDLDEFGEDYPVSYDQTGVIARYGCETIRLLDPKGLNVVENYFETLPPDSADEMAQSVLPFLSKPTYSRASQIWRDHPQSSSIRLSCHGPPL